MSAAVKRALTPPGRMAGLTLLEILVAMMIGLIGVVVITQTYLVNENYKRSTTSAGGAQTNGALALYSIERDIRMSGWGISASAALACSSMRWHYNGAFSDPPVAGGTLPAIRVAPVVITDGGAGNPDTITVFYGTGTERTIPATLSGAMTDSNSPFTIDNPQGFSQTPGDLVLLVQGATCALTQLTNVDAGGVMTHAAGVTALYNPAAPGTLPIFGTGAQVFNLGRPVVNVYSITANNLNLQLASLFTANSSLVVPGYTPTPFTIVEDIVDLQAEYGKDNGLDNGTVQSALFGADDGRVDSYDSVTPLTGPDWQRVLSIRIGVLARSEYFEKPDPPGAPCTATTVAPSWRGGNFSVPGGIPSCYRYRVFETVVPIRNMIWRQT